MVLAAHPFSGLYNKGRL